MSEPTGSQLGLEGMALADAHASEDWKARWDKAIALLAIGGRGFTADDVREIAGAPEDHPNAAGARFHAAALKGLIRQVGYRRSDRPSRHAAVTAVWQGTAAAALGPDRPHAEVTR